MAKGNIVDPHAVDRRNDSLDNTTTEPWSSDQKFQTPARSLAEFREREGRTNRKERLHALWQQICNTGYLSHSEHNSEVAQANSGLSADRAEQLRAAYEAELFGSCGAQSSKKQIGWTEFKTYALAKEVGTAFVHFLFVLLLILS